MSDWQDRLIEVKRMRAGDILPHDRNPRRHPKQQLEPLKGLLDEVGKADVLRAYYSERNGGKLTFWDGHARRDLDNDQEWSVAIFDLTDAEADKLLLSFDPLASLAAYDKQALDALLRDVTTGDAALQEMLSELAKDNGLTYGTQEPATAPEPEIDRAEELQKKWGTELGQLWQIGNHRLLCGDSTAPQDVERVLAGAKPHLMVTDPPYGVGYKPEWRNDALGEANRAVGEVANDDKADWAETWNLFKGGVAYVWHDALVGDVVKAELLGSGFQLRSQIVWAKQHFALSRGHYNWQHEACWYAVRKGQKTNWKGAASESTLWTINNNLAQNGGSESTGTHGTQKPLECMARPIRNHEGDVYDPFVGVGTTIVAAEQLKRKCYAIDIDPKWVAVTLERLSQMNLQPKLIEQGVPANA